MSKNIIIKLKKIGNRVGNFSISDIFGNILLSNVTPIQLKQGVVITVNDNINNILLTYLSKKCCNEVNIIIPITTTTSYELAAITTTASNTSSVWKHLTDITSYNNYYGCIHPYIIEYPFSYQVNDEIVQNVKDYTKSYKYLSPITGTSDDYRKIEVNDYFNKSILYNGQQSSGILNLVAKPINNMKEYMKYPIFENDSKSIIYTKSDNLYQYNNFWNIVKDKYLPLFTTSCESMSIDKEVNQTNMEYTTRSFRKDTIRAKELKVRHILDNKTDVHLVSQFILTPSQISYK